MLASFVLPNHPDVGKVVDLARRLLGDATGDPSLAGYQSKDPGRVRAMARAVYGALGNLGITYANPPRPRRSRRVPRRRPRRSGRRIRQRCRKPRRGSASGNGSSSISPSAIAS